MRLFPNNILLKLKATLAITSVLFVSACTSLFPSPPEQLAQNIEPNIDSVERYTKELAMELFSQVNNQQRLRFAVAGFVPVDTLVHDHSKQGPLMLLGHQLEQGLISEALVRGLIAQDFKATNSIIISENADRALSRDLSHLSQLQNVDYFITGTITEQQNGATVNARIINVDNKFVIAAATHFIPANVFWEHEQVSTRNGMLYRSDSLPSTRSALNK